MRLCTHTTSKPIATGHGVLCERTHGTECKAGRTVRAPCLRAACPGRQRRREDESSGQLLGHAEGTPSTLQGSRVAQESVETLPSGASVLSGCNLRLRTNMHPPVESNKRIAARQTRTRPPNPAAADMAAPAMDTNDLGKALWEAAKEGNTAEARRLLDERAPVDWQNDDAVSSCCHGAVPRVAVPTAQEKDSPCSAWRAAGGVCPGLRQATWASPRQLAQSGLETAWARGPAWSAALRVS